MGKKTGILGSILIVGLTAGLLMYQKDQNEHQIIAQTETVEQQNQQENISGHIYVVSVSTGQSGFGLAWMFYSKTGRGI